MLGSSQEGLRVVAGVLRFANWLPRSGLAFHRPREELPGSGARLPAGVSIEGAVEGERGAVESERGGVERRTGGVERRTGSPKIDCGSPRQGSPSGFLERGS